MESRLVDMMEEWEREMAISPKDAKIHEMESAMRDEIDQLAGFVKEAYKRAVEDSPFTKLKITSEIERRFKMKFTKVSSADTAFNMEFTNVSSPAPGPVAPVIEGDYEEIKTVEVPTIRHDVDESAKNLHTVEKFKKG